MSGKTPLARHAARLAWVTGALGLLLFLAYLALWIDPDLARRSYYANEVEVTTGCPGGTLTLNRTRVITRLTENCHKVVVDAPFTTLLAEKVDILTVSQNSGMGHFIIREIGSAKVEAPFSYLYWDRGNPKLDVTGFRTVAKPNPVSER